ncbi:MAG: hypothetical protein AB7Q23_02950 [Hyphomonadaceae bacterium]
MLARIIIAAVAAAALAACGDLGANLEQAKQDAATLAQETIQAGAGALDTKNACMLAGQPEAFCGCLSDRLGPDASTEQLQAMTDYVRARLSGEQAEAAALGADAATREALLTCAASSAIEGGAVESAN